MCALRKQENAQEVHLVQGPPVSPVSCEILQPKRSTNSTTRWEANSQLSEPTGDGGHSHSNHKSALLSLLLSHLPNMERVTLKTDFFRVVGAEVACE